MEEKIIVNHEIMEDVSKKFENMHEATVQYVKKFHTITSKFKGGASWEGEGWQAMKEETLDEVVPAWNRLMEALRNASSLSKQISDEFSQTDEEI